MSLELEKEGHFPYELTSLRVVHRYYARTVSDAQSSSKVPLRLHLRGKVENRPYNNDIRSTTQHLCRNYFCIYSTLARTIQVSLTQILSQFRYYIIWKAFPELATVIRHRYLQSSPPG